jgi:hypothetical protein
MREMLIAIAGVMLSTLTAQAQSEATNRGPALAEAQSAQISSELLVPPQSPPSPGLPDMPLPHPLIPQDGPAPCPAGAGKPCALLGGRLYFKDPFHMTEHNATWRQAMKNPFMIVGEILNMAATIADVEGTQACLHARTCKEGNPLTGSNPSRASSYGITVPISLGIYALSGWLKKEGQGNLAFGMLWGGTVAHAFMAEKAATLAQAVPATP